MGCVGLYGCTVASLSCDLGYSRSPILWKDLPTSCRSYVIFKNTHLILWPRLFFKNTHLDQYVLCLYEKKVTYDIIGSLLDCDHGNQIMLNVLWLTYNCVKYYPNDCAPIIDWRLCVDGLNRALREACSVYDRGSGYAPHSEDEDWNLQVKEHHPQSHPSIARPGVSLVTVGV